MFSREQLQQLFTNQNFTSNDTGYINTMGDILPREPQLYDELKAFIVATKI
jgi:hypothetical protein